MYLIHLHALSAKYPLADSLFDPHKMVLPFNVFRHLHLEELISLKSVAEASPTLTRCVTIPFG